MVSAKQYALMRAMQDEEYQEVHEAIEHMNDSGKGSFSPSIERKQKADEREAPEDLREKMHLRR